MISFFKDLCINILKNLHLWYPTHELSDQEMLTLSCPPMDGIQINK